MWSPTSPSQTCRAGTIANPPSEQLLSSAVKCFALDSRSRTSLRDVELLSSIRSTKRSAGPPAARRQVLDHVVQHSARPGLEPRSQRSTWVRAILGRVLERGRSRRRRLRTQAPVTAASEDSACDGGALAARSRSQFSFSLRYARARSRSSTTDVTPDSARQARHHAARGVEQVLRLAAFRRRREDLVARRHADAAAGLREQAQQALRVDAAVLGAAVSTISPFATSTHATPSARAWILSRITSSRWCASAGSAP